MSSRASAVVGTLVFLITSFVTRQAQSLSYDELFTVWVSARPWSDLLHQANLDGFTPPLFYALVKLVSGLGLRNEELRALPVLFGGFAVFVSLRASERAFGPSSRMVALMVIPFSAFIFTFSHELRPYSALMACTFLFLAQIADTPTPATDRRAAIAALAATLFSYLGVMLVIIWFVFAGRRSSRPGRLSIGTAALLICVPGLMKVLRLHLVRAEADIPWVSSELNRSLGAALFGLAPMPFSAALGVAFMVGSVVLALLAAKHRTERAILIIAFVVLASGGMIVVFDQLVKVGFAARYLALPMAALLLLIVGVVSRLRTLAIPIAFLLMAANVLAIVRYLSVVPAPRENWREAIERLRSRLGHDGVLLAFPFHHAAAAAAAYAPDLQVGGGFTSRTGPVFWYEPPVIFRGYDFDDLKRVDDPRVALRRLTSARDVCLFSDEPDPAKTQRLFDAFRAMGGTSAFDTGDTRLRAVCWPESRGVRPMD